MVDVFVEVLDVMVTVVKFVDDVVCVEVELVLLVVIDIVVVSVVVVVQVPFVDVMVLVEEVEVLPVKVVVIVVIVQDPFTQVALKVAFGSYSTAAGLIRSNIHAVAVVMFIPNVVVLVVVGHHLEPYMFKDCSTPSITSSVGLCVPPKSPEPSQSRVLLV